MRTLAPAGLPVILVVAMTATAQARDLRVGVDAPTIQAAIDAASGGDRVIVPAGIYRENLDFEGKAITLRGEAGAAGTFLDGGAATGPVLRIESGEGRGTIVEGLTIRGAFEEGILVTNASPTIRDCIVASNGRGGRAGISLTGSGARVERCAIVGNGGSGVYLFIPRGAEIVGNEIRGNVQLAGGGGGGGVLAFMNDGSMLLERNVIAGNRAENGGGVFVAGLATIVENGISGNTATVEGGGVYWRLGSAQPPQALMGNTIAANAAPDGTALVLDFTYAHDADVRIAGNVLAGAPGAAAVLCERTVPASVAVSIVRNDVWAGGSAAWTGTLADPAGTNGNVAADPRFAAVSAGDFRLAADSPCIDAGDTAAAGLPPTDLVGAPRSLDGDGDGSAVADIGAFEFSGAPRVAAVRLENAVVDVSEDGGPLTLTVRRDGGDLPAASVRVRTVALTATERTDFGAVDAVVMFAPGQTTAAVSVPIADDGLFEPDEFLALTIDQPDAGCVVGPYCAAAFRVTDALAKVASYFPLPPGTRWRYRQANGAITRAEVLPGHPIVNGVATTVILNTADHSRMFVTLDDLGLRLHRLGVSGVPLPPFGRRNVSITFDPPVAMTAARVSMISLDDPVPIATRGTAELWFAGLGRRRISYSATFSAKRGDATTAGTFAAPFDPLVVDGWIDVAGQKLEYGVELGPGLGVVKSFLPSTGEAAVLTDTDLGRHVLSIKAVGVPRPMRLRVKPIVARVDVTVRNGGDRDEVIEDAAMLDAFVALDAASLGAAAAPAVARAGHTSFPLVVRAGKTAHFRYAVTVAAASDPGRGAGHEDFRVTATVTPAALDRFVRSPLLPPVAGPVHAESLLDVFAK